MSEEKVYCKGCKYLMGLWYEDHFKTCKKAVNKHDTFFSKDRLIYYTLASTVNKDNNCINRIQKPWWMFWRG